MPNIETYHNNAELAMAAYAILWPKMSLDDYAKALITCGMTVAQANGFIKKYAVVDQYIGEFGASATIFRVKKDDKDDDKSGDKILAIPGTASVADVLVDGILALGFPSFINPQFLGLRSQVEFWLDSKVLTGDYTIVGHSLGGYLAAALGSWYRGHPVYMYNAPGIGGGVGNAVDAFKAALGFGDLPFVSDIYNIRASEGIPLISGLGTQLAPPTIIQTDAAAGGEFGPGNHSIKRLVDALAVHALYSHLDSSLSLEQIGDIFKIANNHSNLTVESALDVLRGTLLGTGVTRTPMEDRDTFYSNLYALQNSDAYKSLAGQLTLQIASQAALNREARTDFSALVALEDLYPVVVKATDGAQAQLQAIWQNTRATQYAAWQDDQCTATPSNYTNQWMQDRAMLLRALCIRNNSDIDQDTPIHDPNLNKGQALLFDYQDPTTGQQQLLFVRGVLNPFVDTPQQVIRFGNDRTNTLIGTNGMLGDHLYGGGGDDTLTGGKGSDYLEGGSGYDTYDLSGNAPGDVDTLFDSDGSGQIVLNGQTIGGAFSQIKDSSTGQGVGNSYYSADGQYRLQDSQNGNWTLAVSNGSGTYAALAFLQGWDKNQRTTYLGLTLGDPVASVPVSVADYSRSAAYLNFNAVKATGGVVITGNAKSGSVTGSSYADVIRTGDGNTNYVTSYGGNDIVYGGSGHEYIRTGLGGVGANDDDIAYGGEASDMLYGGSGNDELWGNSDAVVSVNGVTQYAFELTAADSGERGDWISGEDGDDLIFGSRSRDVLFGGAGSDTIRGGAGDDLILGDARYSTNSMATALPYAAGSTISCVWSATNSFAAASQSGYATDAVMVANGTVFS